MEETCADEQTTAITRNTQTLMLHNEMEVTSQDTFIYRIKPEGLMVLCLWVRLHAACNLC